MSKAEEYLKKKRYLRRLKFLDRCIYGLITINLIFFTWLYWVGDPKAPQGYVGGVAGVLFIVDLFLFTMIGGAASAKFNHANAVGYLREVDLSNIQT